MNKRRLLKLARHLESGNLGHKKFDFDNYNRAKTGGYVPYKCGYAGCAIGEMPILFPDEWRFDNDGFPVLKGKDVFEMPIDSGVEFFEISDGEYSHLFVPNNQLPFRYGGDFLSDNATPKQVASNIRAFVKKMEGK